MITCPAPRTDQMRTATRQRALPMLLLIVLQCGIQHWTGRLAAKMDTCLFGCWTTITFGTIYLTPESNAVMFGVINVMMT